MATKWIKAYDVSGFIRASHISAIFIGRRALRNDDGVVVRDPYGQTTEGYCVCASVRGSTYQISKVFVLSDLAKKELNRLIGVAKEEEEE